MEYQRSSPFHSSGSSYTPSDRRPAASNHVFTIHYLPLEDPTSPIADNIDSIELFGSMESFDLTGQLTRISSTPEFLGTYSFVHREYLKGEMVAVKVLRLASDNVASMRRKVQREREVWASLAHPNILPFYGFTSDPAFGDFGALISPWCMAGDTDQFLRAHGTSMTPRIGFNLLWKGVVSGVHYLHTRTPIIIHGDIKPGNVLVDDLGNPKLCDFGLVRIILDEEAEIGLTPTSEHTGTPRYLAIELLKNEKARPTIASDVHALGCLGLEVIFSRKPHAQRKNNLRGGVHIDIRRGLPPAIRDDNLSLLEGCAWSLLEQCWRLEPGLRLLTRAILAGTNKLLFHALYGHLLCDTHMKKPSDSIKSFLILGNILRRHAMTLPRSDSFHKFCLYIILESTGLGLIRLVDERIFKWLMEMTLEGRRLLLVLSLGFWLFYWERLVGLFPLTNLFDPTMRTLAIDDLAPIIYGQKRFNLPPYVESAASAIIVTLLRAWSGIVSGMAAPLESEPYPREPTFSKLGNCPLCRHGNLPQEQMSREAAAASRLLRYIGIVLVLSAINLDIFDTNPKIGIATSIVSIGFLYIVGRGFRVCLLDFIEACVDGTPPRRSRDGHRSPEWFGSISPMDKIH